MVKNKYTRSRSNVMYATNSYSGALVRRHSNCGTFSIRVARSGYLGVVDSRSKDVHRSRAGRLSY